MRFIEENTKLVSTIFVHLFDFFAANSFWKSRGKFAEFFSRLEIGNRAITVLLCCCTAAKLKTQGTQKQHHAGCQRGGGGKVTRVSIIACRVGLI